MNTENYRTWQTHTHRILKYHYMQYTSLASLGVTSKPPRLYDNNMDIPQRTQTWYNGAIYTTAWAGLTPSSARTQLISAWVQNGAFTSVTWTRLESEVLRHRHSKCICLLCMSRPQLLGSRQQMTRLCSNPLQSQAEHSSLPSTDSQVWTHILHSVQKCLLNGLTGWWRQQIKTDSWHHDKHTLALVNSALGLKYITGYSSF